MYEIPISAHFLICSPFEFSEAEKGHVADHIKAAVERATKEIRTARQRSAEALAAHSE